MHKKSTLSSIPEMDIEEDIGRKWVSKKKHEVLKAKYKCLKKLFQIYDATVIGILPDQNEEIQEPETNHRRKRSHRTKTDACAGTNEVLSSGDLSTTYEHNSVDTGTTGQLELDRSCISTQIDSKIDKYAETVDSEQYFDTNAYTPPLNPSTPVPFNLMFERRKLTRFQCFVQRLFGLRESYVPKDQIYSASDSMVQKRRRRGLRFRRLRRAKKIKSEGSLRDLKSPILSYVQSVQRNCLMDTTPRQCPMPGCKMILFGIINYNDHLNLCHLKDRKFVCHYCHEGFETEQDKLSHENEHIGISKLSSNMMTLASKIASNTQTETDIAEDKLKKIVSFFEKISDPEQMINNIKRNRGSECGLKSDCGTDEGKTRTISCCNIRTDNNKSVSSASVGSSTSRNYGLPVVCHFCGENFNHRRQLSLHVNLEHRAHDKFSKYHSCAGILHRSKSRTAMSSTDGRISVKSDKLSTGDIPRRKSSASLTCETSNSNNSSKVYYSSAETVVPIETARYSWEPGSKVISV